LFAALLVGVVLAVTRLAPARVPRLAGLAAQGVLGVYIGTMVQPDALSSLGPHWPAVVGVGVATLVLSVGAGALLGLHKSITPLTGSLALVAGGASGLVAIARELGGDDRVVAVVQYLRVAVVTATMPVVVTLVYHAERTSHAAAAAPQSLSAPWYLSVMMLVVLVFAGSVVGRLARLPGSGLLGPMALTILAELAGVSFGLTVPVVLVSASYMLIGWQAGVAFTRESLRAIERLLPAALGLIVLLNVATAGLGVALSKITGVSMLDGYLATSPGGIYAVLATAVETGSNVTFIVATQVLRILLMLFAAPLLARGLVRLTYRRARTDANSEPIAVADARPAASTSS
jgi:membrane AbrB-like protein